jgi:hypothetical protein
MNLVKTDFSLKFSLQPVDTLQDIYRKINGENMKKFHYLLLLTLILSSCDFGSNIGSGLLGSGRSSSGNATRSGDKVDVRLLEVKKSPDQGTYLRMSNGIRDQLSLLDDPSISPFGSDTCVISLDVALIKDRTELQEGTNINFHQILGISEFIGTGLLDEAPLYGTLTPSFNGSLYSFANPVYKSENPQAMSDSFYVRLRSQGQAITDQVRNFFLVSQTDLADLDIASCLSKPFYDFNLYTSIVFEGEDSNQEVSVVVEEKHYNLQVLAQAQYSLDPNDRTDYQENFSINDLYSNDLAFHVPMS